MRHAAVNRTGLPQGGDRLDELTGQIGRLLRHRGYEREKIVSPLLLRHLPFDAGYAWQGEASLRERIKRAGLDPKMLEHLIVNARSEFERMLQRISA